MTGRREPSNQQEVGPLRLAEPTRSLDWRLTRWKACHGLLGVSLRLVFLVPQEEDTSGRVKVVQSRQQSRHQAKGTEVHRGLVIGWNSCSFLGITVEVEKENEVGSFKHKASPHTSLGESGV